MHSLSTSLSIPTAENKSLRPCISPGTQIKRRVIGSRIVSVNARLRIEGGIRINTNSQLKYTNKKRTYVIRTINEDETVSYRTKKKITRKRPKTPNRTRQTIRKHTQTIFDIEFRENSIGRTTP